MRTDADLEISDEVAAILCHRCDDARAWQPQRQAQEDSLPSGCGTADDGNVGRLTVEKLRKSCVRSLQLPLTRWPEQLRTVSCRCWGKPNEPWQFTQHIISLKLLLGTHGSSARLDMRMFEPLYVFLCW